MTTIVLAHGAWSAVWAWARMRPLMAAAGHDFFTPTQTGLGERAHLASREVTLDTHIADVAGLIEAEELEDVTLLAHSYGGMVGTGVADRLRAGMRGAAFADLRNVYDPRTAAEAGFAYVCVGRPGAD